MNLEPVLLPWFIFIHSGVCALWCYNSKTIGEREREQFKQAFRVEQGRLSQVNEGMNDR